MKATGIVRRVDSLGRVVIPKEIRQTLRIREGCPLEIYTDRDGSVTFRKYSPMGELSDLAQQACDAIRSVTGFPAAVADPDRILAVSGPSRQALMDRPCSHGLEQLMERRSFYARRGGTAVFPASPTDSPEICQAQPILCQGDLIGCVMLLGDCAPGCDDAHQLLLGAMADFLGRQLEP